MLELLKLGTKVMRTSYGQLDEGGRCIDYSTTEEVWHAQDPSMLSEFLPRFLDPFNAIVCPFNISVKTISKQSPNCSKIDVIEALKIVLSPFQLASDTHSYCNVLYYVVSRQICTHVQVHVDWHFLKSEFSIYLWILQ